MSALASYILPPAHLPPLQEVSRPSGSVFLPKEHGSWSLALEPLALGLLVAPSWAGGALAAAVLAGFFARRPLKAATDPVASPRRRTARVTLGVLSVFGVIGLAEAGVLAGWLALWPLFLAVPFGGLFVWFDRQNQSRVAVAELAGCTAFAFVPAALATLAGWPGEMALVLAAVSAARSLSSILAVRSYLRTSKGEPAGASMAVGPALFAFAGLLALSFTQRAPLVAGVLGAVLLLRSLWLTGSWRPVWPARRIGMVEAILGLLYVGLLAANWTSPLQ